MPTAASPKPPIRPVTPRLRLVLHLVLILFGVLLANGLYLTAITWLQHFTGRIYEDHFYQLMFLVHLGLGLLLIVPTIGFGLLHMVRSRKRRNRRAVKIGYALFAVAIAILVTGLLLMRVGSIAIVDPTSRSFVYWAHLIAPLAVIWLYWLHRLVGPRIKWDIGKRVVLAITVIVAAMVAFQASDPRISDGKAPLQGEKYFQPSLARTTTGKFIAAETLMNDDYCLRCHADLSKSAFHSAHRLSSFNNPAYRASVRETRQVSLERMGSVQASRWCAGCHDPVPFFSGEFDDPNYDDVDNPTAHAGLTCVVCHSIQSVNSNVGNADYTIAEPEHYPFAYSDNPLLQELNSLMVKAKPTFHKHEMLKPFHKEAEFCSVCHKVSLPGEVTNYKEFLRGQNHYDSYLLSGVSGHGARSFYYPPKAQTNCNECHMPALATDEFGAKYMDELGRLGVHSHFFPSANTALAYWMGDSEGVEKHREYLQGTLRVDLFGLRQGGSVSGELVAPLGDRTQIAPGETYLIETVLRTMKLGHHFTQGTTDSNEIWIELTATQSGKVIGRSGHRDEREAVYPDSHFVNTFMLDREGNRINRRNAQDIFTPLYSHQIPPGAGQTVHYRLTTPSDSNEPIEISAKLLYRKFDTEYLDYIRRDRDPERDKLNLGRPGDPNDLPIVEIASDKLVLVFDEVDEDPSDSADTDSFPLWQRWNDYGIGMLLKGKAELKQAAEAFHAVEELGRFDGPLNLARVQFAEGDLDGATESLHRAATMDPLPPSWTHSWLSGIVNRQQGNLDTAAESLRNVLETKIVERGFDFSLDYEVRNELGLTLIDLAQRAEVQGDEAASRDLLAEAQRHFEKVLEIDSENVTAHANLAEIFAWSGDGEKEQYHRTLHAKFKPDDNAAEVAIPAARRRYPAANHAAEALVIYDLAP
ncbi:tetratricopeptide repeat protein [Aporhodopirellula aestuarii]|uniref:Tetratricopeptide repeat protein n=1 Tax=Aporhodopirellula aestuarii TaxID=2950107 RepID=A0ABT0TYL9_9BACT|nr:tetratricopeptide repeat protein [Aporhodopirellula aestuarii]MCM2369693.1 tetratricopeptide repeat protein [Aporhodopirellula aestuarii]